MKVAIVFLALLGSSLSAPQSRKVFHEHVQDFLDIIEEEVGPELEHIMEHYLEYDEFMATFNFMRTSDFKNLVYEMESLPEFKAVIDFLERDNIDILYFIDLFNTMVEATAVDKKQIRHELSGTDFKSFIKDSIDILPKDQLASLFDQKLADDQEFKEAMENLMSEEWEDLLNALWEDESFQAEIKTLAENGIEINILIEQIVAIFGQN